MGSKLYFVSLPKEAKVKIVSLKMKTIEEQKLIWLASFIFRIEMDTVSSQYLKEVLGNSYKQYVLILVRLGIIIQYKSYFADPNKFGNGFCKTYQYIGNKKDVVIENLTLKGLVNKSLMKEEKDFELLPLHVKRSQHYIENGVRLDKDEALIKVLVDHEKSCTCQTLFKSSLVEAYLALNEINCDKLKMRLFQVLYFQHSNRVYYSRVTGRIYNIINQLNRLSRRCLYDIKSGKPLMEVDISQSHLFFLAIESNDEELLNVVTRNDFYEINRGKLDRDQFKVKVYQFLNSPLDNRSYVYNVFYRKYPSALIWIEEYVKDNGTKGRYGLSNYLSREEAHLVHEAMILMNKQGYDCIPIHDSIMSIDPVFCEMMLKEAFELLGFPTFPQFSIK